jgi:hypothetical protein
MFCSRKTWSAWLRLRCNCNNWEKLKRTIWDKEEAYNCWITDMLEGTKLKVSILSRGALGNVTPNRIFKKTDSWGSATLLYDSFIYSLGKPRDGYFGNPARMTIGRLSQAVCFSTTACMHECMHEYIYCTDIIWLSERPWAVLVNFYCILHRLAISGDHEGDLIGGQSLAYPRPDIAYPPS